MLMKIGLVAAAVLAVSIPFYIYFIQILKQNQERDFSQVQVFGFIFKWWGNELNTFNGTFAHDMVIDPPITINLTLTSDEMKRVYLKMVEVGFFTYAQKDAEIKNWVIVTPCGSYYLKVKYDSLVKELTWDDNSLINLKLKKLTNFIIEIIHAHEEFKQLPPPRGGYI